MSENTNLAMRRWLRRGLVAIAFVAVASSPLWWNAGTYAQERSSKQQGREQPPTDDQMAEMMKRYEEAAAPGKAHELLSPLVGTFNVTAKFESPQGTITSTGKSSCEWVLEGRFLKQDFTGMMESQKFTGIGYTGYDNSKKKYQATWMDSMSTAIFYMEGEVDSSGKTLTLTGEGMDPAAGEMKKYQHVWNLENKDEIVFEMFEVGAGGQPTKTATLTYKRVVW